jgi:hypothetical protein
MNFQPIFDDISDDIWQKVVKIGKNTEGVTSSNFNKTSRIRC